MTRPIMALKRMSHYLPRLLLKDSGSKMAVGLPRPTLTTRYSNAIWLHRIATTAQQQSTTQQSLTENVFKQLQDQQVQHKTKIQSLQAIVKDVQCHLASVPNQANPGMQMLDSAGSTMFWVVFWVGMFGGVAMYARDDVGAVDCAANDAKLVTPGLCPGTNPGVTSTPVPVATTKQGEPNLGHLQRLIIVRKVNQEEEEEEEGELFATTATEGSKVKDTTNSAAGHAAQ